MAIITEADQFVQDSANNFIYNRFDIIYPGNYKCLRIHVDDTTNHIGLHMDGDTAYLGVWCIEIPETAFTDLTRFVFRRYSQNKITQYSKLCRCDFQKAHQKERIAT